MINEKKNLIIKTFLIVLFTIILVIIVTYLYDYVSINYGDKKAYNYIQFPFIFIGSLFILFAVFSIGFQTFHLDRETTKKNNYELSNYTHTVVVDGWERNAFEYNKELSKMYQHIFSKPSGYSKNSFISKKEWDNLGLNVPYVPYKGNEIKWNYAAQFCQEMTNIYRMFNLDKQYKIGNKKDLIKSKSTEFSGWFSSFRMWLSVPIVRNVWEQYKYRHINPSLSAWVKYFITDPIDNDKNFWIKHREEWNKKINQILSSNKE